MASVTQVGGISVNVSSTLIRPADTTQYAANDALANSTTAANIIPLQFTIARVDAGSFGITRVRLRSGGTSLTAAQFRLHLYNSYIPATSADNAAMTVPLVGKYLGYVDTTCDTLLGDGIWGATYTSWIIKLNQGRDIYGLAQNLSTYTPASAEAFTWTLEGVVD
jgi:hypothetical protein